MLVGRRSAAPSRGTRRPARPAERTLSQPRQLRDPSSSARGTPPLSPSPFFDCDLNAIVVRDFERARLAADEADRALASGDAPGPLHGVPMTIKESFDIAGLPTTWGIPVFQGNIASSDARAVVSFKKAGAVFMGKSNVPMNLADFQSYNDIYGTTNSPWDRAPPPPPSRSRLPLPPAPRALRPPSLSIGSHPPTPPRSPGRAAPPRPGVLAPRAPPPRAPPPPAASSPARPPPFSPPTPSRVRVTAVSRARGATLSDTARPEIDFPSAHVIYLKLLNAILGAGVPPEMYAAAQARAAQYDPADQSDEAVIARALVISHAEWLAAHNQRELLRMAWRSFFDDWDILICPQMPTAAFEHDHSPFETRSLRVGDEEQPYFKQIFWAGFAIAAYLPSTVFPTGPSAAGLPIGLQAVGAEYDDLCTIDFTRLVAEEIGGFVPPPDYV